MRYIRALAVCYLLFSSTTAWCQTDMVDLHNAQVFNSPTDIADWAKTLTIKSVSMDPSVGVTIETNDDTPTRWMYHVPGWGDKNFTDAQKAHCNVPGIDNGCIERTVWVVAIPNGQLATSGIVQMWDGRENTGTFETSGGWATEFPKNWAYDGRWGTLAGYSPPPTAQLGFFVSAGNARGDTSVTSVRERSNVVVIPATVGSWTFNNEPPPPPPPPPPSDLEKRLTVIEGKMRDVWGHLAQVDAKIKSLEARKIPVSCVAVATNPGPRIPISCKLQ
jgi:hypothetical protein